MTKLRIFLAAVAAAIGTTLAVGAWAAVPVVAKQFVDPANTGDASPAIPLGGVAALALVILNPNPDPITGVAFTDNFPAGVQLVPAPTNPVVSNDCGGTLTANQGAGSVSLSGGTVGAAGGNPVVPGQCKVILLVQGVISGNHLNSFSVTSSAGASEAASDTLRVNFPPTISKVFSADSVKMLNQSTATLTITIGNPNGGEPLSGLIFADDFPNGLIVADPTGATNTCGGTLTAAANTGAVVLQGGSVAAGGSCTVTVNVTGVAPGVQNNTIAQVVSTNGGASTGGASDSILVIAPPVIIKQFVGLDPNVAPTTTPLNGLAVMQFVIANPNTSTVLTGVAFNDLLPAGLVVAAQPTGLPTNSCGGTLTATPGAGSISLANGTVAVGSGNPVQPGICSIVVAVTGTTAGRKNNSVSATSTEGGTSLAPAEATILVQSPPVLTKVFASAFNPPSVVLNASTTLTFTMTNPNPVDGLVDAALLNVTFADDMRQQPGDVVKILVATPNGAVGNLCGGTLTAPDGSPAIALQGATIPAASSCVFSIIVTGVAAGTENNATTPISSDNGGVGLAAAATLYVVAPPVIGKAFGAETIIHGDTTTLTVTIVNPVENTIPLTGVSFVDLLPPGIMIANPNGLTGSCFDGLITAPAFTRNLSLSGASIPVNASCTFTLTVVGTAQDTENVNVTGTVTSANGGDGNTATATLRVVPRIIPTLQEWALVLMSLLLALSALVVMRRQGIR